MTTSSTGVMAFVPSVTRGKSLSIEVAASPPSGATVLGIPVTSTGSVPAELGIDRDALSNAGFDGAVGQALALPRTGAPLLVAFGTGDPAQLDGGRIRDSAAAFATATRTHSALAVALPADGRLASDAVAAALVEGVVLARYCYDPLKQEPAGQPLEAMTLVAADGELGTAAAGALVGKAFANATALARDLANAPPGHMTATHIAEVAAALASDRGLEIEVLDETALTALGCGGMLGVNSGTAEPPRLVKLRYAPRDWPGDSGRLTFVGKGVMYDSGGISLKPADAVHATMKTDMSGAGAVLGAMSELSSLQCPTPVTAYLCCVENMPSGTALRMGDVITIHGGKSVEVLNTDAEGRLIMADALVMAAEEGTAAIIDIATLTGACMRALGDQVAGVLGNDRSVVDQLLTAAERTDEPLWQLPLDKRYRKQLDSQVADLQNMGSGAPAEPGAVTAALFLAEFVDGVPWAHIDIAGTAHRNSTDGWRLKGASGFGARLLIEAALRFAPPASSDVADGAAGA